MTIVCGTDFSTAARAAVVVAAGIAARTGDRLLIVNAATGSAALDRVAPHEQARGRLADAVSFARELGSAPEGTLADGDAAEALRAACARTDAWLLVIGGTARGESSREHVGDVARHLLRRASCPWLVVTDAEPWVAWTRAARPLRVTVGSDLTAASTTAMRFVRKLRAVGPIEAQAAHVAWPPAAHHHVAAHGPMPLDVLRTDVADALRGELRQAAARAFDEPAPAVEVAHSFGRPEQELLRIAQTFGADVLVVGRRYKSWRERLTSPAVAAGVLRLSPISALVVPSEAAAESRPSEPS